MASAADRAERLASRKGFTLVEVLLVMALMSVLIAGVISAFLMFSRGGIAMGNYERMERRSRMLLETFARDVRDADGASFPSERRLTLSQGGVTVAYEYDPEDGEVTVARSDVAGLPRALASSIAGFEFKAYDSDGAAAALSSDASNTIKMIQIALDLASEVTGAPDTTAAFVSSRYVLRNKAIPAP